MKSLTVRQPWAQLVALGVKTLETRSRPTSYRGQIAIHAALRLGPEMDGFAGVLGDWSVHRGSKDGDVLLHGGKGHGTDLDAYQIALGAVVAVAELVDCVPIHSIDGDLPYEPHLLVDEPGGLVHRALTDDVLGCPMRETRIDDQLPYGDFTPGRWAWMLAGVRPLAEPYQMRGHQGLRDVPLDCENQIMAAVS